MQVRWKKVLAASVVAAVIILGVRYYVLDMAVRSFAFGCDTAATKVYRFYSKDIGEKTFDFCKVYSGNIKKEFFGR